MKNKKVKTIGFGLEENNKNVFHFAVIIPKENVKNVKIYEQSEIFDSELDGTYEFDNSNLKADINKEKWLLLEKAVEMSFNDYLSKGKYGKSKWKIGVNLVDKLLGKELLLLIWAINGYDKKCIPKAIKNWQSLDQEERWWLFTMTNAVKGKCNDKGWWRTAISYILCEDPTEEATFDLLAPKEEE